MAGVKIYDRVLAVTAVKGKGEHRCDDACRRLAHRYIHRFKTKEPLIGNKDGTLTIGRGGRRNPPGDRDRGKKLVLLGVLLWLLWPREHIDVILDYGDPEMDPYDGPAGYPPLAQESFLVPDLRTGRGILPSDRSSFLDPLFYNDGAGTRPAKGWEDLLY